MPRNITTITLCVLATLSCSSLAFAEDAQSPRDGACAGVSCGGHGTCELVDGLPRCRCDEGFDSEVFTDEASYPPIVLPTCIGEAPSESTPEGRALVAARQRSGRSMFVSGIVLECFGAPATLAGPFFMFWEFDWATAIGAALLGVGLPLALIGTLLIVFGNRRRRARARLSNAMALRVPSHLL
jgi:ribosomal protein L34